MGGSLRHYDLFPRLDKFDWIDGWRLVALGMAAFTLVCMAVIAWYDQVAMFGLLETCVFFFVAFWIMQFWGHKIEGQKPSFFEDLQFLLIGPAWVIGFAYRKLGIQY